VAFTGTYTLADTRERDGRQLALMPKRSGSVLAAVDTGRTRAGFDVSFTGEQRLDANPYRSTSEAFTLVNLFGEQRFGRFRLFINLDNVTDVRQTDWDPMARPSRDIDGRWTVDAWAPVKGRVINGGLRIVF
jgi:outer membrane receptor for ferrienterochelin and colicins